MSQLQSQVKTCVDDIEDVLASSDSLFSNEVHNRLSATYQRFLQHVWCEVPMNSADGSALATVSCMPIWELLNQHTSACVLSAAPEKAIAVQLLSSMYPKSKDRRCVFQQPSCYGSNSQTAVPLSTHVPIQMFVPDNSSAEQNLEYVKAAQRILRIATVGNYTDAKESASVASAVRTFINTYLSLPEARNLSLFLCSSRWSTRLVELDGRKVSYSELLSPLLDICSLCLSVNPRSVSASVDTVPLIDPRVMPFLMGSGIKEEHYEIGASFATERVNYGGTVNVIRACKEHGVKKMIFSSSPSTRFNGSLFHRPNVDGLTEDEMPKLPLERYMQMYAQTKAEGEMAMRESIDDDFWSIAVAPHQVYGPRDNLFLPNMLEAAGTGKLRVFGKGDNRICFTHVDNYCHGLIIAEKQLYKNSPYLGRFYIVTDADTHPEPAAYCIFWKELDKAIVRMGFGSIMNKVHYPFWFLYIAALFAELAGWVMGTTFKLNVFNVFVLTMNRWFRVDAAKHDLEFQPIIPFGDGWNDTIEWFQLNWLPKFKKQDHSSIAGISSGSQQKINIQARKDK
ncbi:3-beta hydroxysteroid dehydrogenase/isomerase family protein [Leishmania donovani]|uniref:3-beta hydroxysteroid dehydrogenase/isomerase family protein n=1 Tax=Leishmania donovani TaxID=5661 RepID=A0A504XN51_LEIDO|nr:3-beta hydroxysteroid dehydrogenase/isomerase family protein [Leishmania donovani]